MWNLRPRMLGTALQALRDLAGRLSGASPEGGSGRTLVSGLAWATGGSGLAHVLTLGMGILVARILGLELFGAFGLIQATVSAFGVFAAPTIGLTANKYVAELVGRDDLRVARVLALTTVAAIVLSMAFSALLWFGAPYITIRVLDLEPTLVSPLRWAALILFFTGIDGAQRGALAGFHAFRMIALTNVARAVLSLPVMVIAAWNWGLLGAVIAFALTSGFGCLLNSVGLWKVRRAAGIPARAAGWTSEWRLLATFSLPALVGGIVAMPANWAVSAILVRSPHGLSQVGILNAALAWRNAILFVPTVANQPFLSALASASGAGALKRFRRLLGVNIAVTTVGALLPATAIAVAGPMILRSYGPEFSEGLPALLYLSASAVIMSAVSAIGVALWCMERMWAGAALNCLWSAVLLLCAWPLAGHGAGGIGMAYLVAAMVHLGTVGAYVVHTLRSGRERRSAPSSSLDHDAALSR